MTLSNLPPLVTVFGGSGFVGRHVVRALARRGYRIRVAVRRPDLAGFLQPIGGVGQISFVQANLRYRQSVDRAVEGSDHVINCVGVLFESGRNTFDAVQDFGARAVAEAARAAGAKLTHISAIGADAASDSVYARTKGEGEAAVLAAFPAAVILRPSVIFGTEDHFFNRFAGMTRMGPVLPIVGAVTKFQPVHVDDVARAAVKGVLRQAGAGVYELGGPEADSLRGLMGRMLHVIQRRRAVVNVPFFLARIIGFGFDMVQGVTLGLVENKVLTRDQVKNLRHDNVVSAGARGFADLGITPTAMEAVLPEYLWRYRPSGQYAAIMDSAKNLKKA